MVKGGIVGAARWCWGGTGCDFNDAGVGWVMQCGSMVDQCGGGVDQTTC